MNVVLWQVEISHYSEKVRWALDFKSIGHTRRTPLPGLHGLYALALTAGRQRRLPVLAIDGRRIGDSTAIIAELETQSPEPPLYPLDPSDRVRALALEDYFDLQLAPPLRRYLWHHTLPDVDATIEALMPHAGPGRVRFIRAIGPVARPLVRRDYQITQTTAARALGEIRAAMDRVEQELQPSGYLVGESFTVADLTAAALFTPVLAPPQRPYAPRSLAPALLESREELASRTGGMWVAEMYARHRGPPAALVRR